MDDSSVPFDVVVIGAGAAGLVAGIRAAERGLRVLVLEKNRKPGVKILISGGTRCNITNARGLRRLNVVSGPIDPAYDPDQSKGSSKIAKAFGPGGQFLGPALKEFSVEQSIALFEAEGVATKIEANGKVFPVSDKAIDVLNALVGRLNRSGAELRLQSPALKVSHLESGSETPFSIDLGSGSVRARQVILAVGGKSFPGAGTVGDGYRFAAELGHTIVLPRPALVPIRVEESWITGLKGITMPKVAVAALASDGSVAASRIEAVLFAHFGLTGPAILDISEPIARAAPQERFRVRLDLLPDSRWDAVDRTLGEAARSGRRTVMNLLPDSIPKRLAEGIVRAAQIPEHRIGPELSKVERKRLVQQLKALELRTTGTLGFEKAEVTSGGIALEEVNSKTMESRLCPGLFVIGEVLDLNGLIGGYNFQAAWSTGWLAGSSVSKSSVI